jgi:alpha-L-fucosidase
VPAKDKLTYNAAAKRLYVHLFEYPTTGMVVLPGYKGKIKYAQFLHDNSELIMKEDGNDILLTVPVKKPGYEIPVVELTLN